MDVRETVEAFVAAINRRDPHSIAALMSEDHLFVDSLGAHMAGRETMRSGWLFYFELFPDYRIEVDRILVDGSEAMLHGHAAATLNRGGAAVENGAWRIPAAWRATVSDGLVSLWQVYADNKPVYALLEG